VAWHSVNVAELTALQAALSSIAAGGAISIPYTYKTSGGLFVAGNGHLATDNNANQSAATQLYLDDTNASLKNIAPVLNLFDDSTSAVKGYVRVTSVSDASKFLIFKMTSMAFGVNYKQLVGTVVQASSTNPFTVNESLVLYFQPTGDVGSAGIINRRRSFVNTISPLIMDISTTDILDVTALAIPMTIAAPVGAVVGCPSIMYRIKDNGTARALSWNAAFRASTDIILPTSTTVGKWLVVGFLWNNADSQWDLMASTLAGN
jgi:hypothetical protein